MTTSIEPLWQPRAQQIAAANITRFARFVEDRFAVDAAEYDSLWHWSVERREDFWSAVWDFCDVIASNRGDQVLINGSEMLGAKWFPDARLNFAENLLRRRDDEPAIIFWNEQGRQCTISFHELYNQTARLAASLRRWGVQSGDRVAAFLPNIPQAIVAMLAATSLGAIFSSCSPDFGIAGAVDRLGQISPRVLFVADGYFYGGKTFATLDKGVALVEQIPSIETCVLVPYVDVDVQQPAGQKWKTWSEAVANDEQDTEFAQLPFDHPLYILFSSGTTGIPKCIVHGVGGTLLQHYKEHVLHTDLHFGDRLFYYTSTGWMMWNWLASALASGCTLILYDGSPTYPDELCLWKMAEAEQVTAFGASAKYFAALEKAGTQPAQVHRLDALRTILSTGSPLAPESFDYVYREIKSDVCLASISGGTDIVSCFVLGNPAMPVYRGEIQVRGLGMKVEVFDDQGRSVVGQKGELVCTAAFPSMPVEFLNDPDRSRYRAAYFEHFPGVWRHGDYTELTPRGGAIIYGRSDAVLNPGGVRIGTSEIYREVEQIPEVVEAIAIGQSWKADVRVVLFVTLRPEVVLDDSLRQEIKNRIRTGASPRHVPAKILQVSEIPRTRSGKIVELAVSDVVHSRTVKNRDALANPDALAEFANRPELKED